MSIWHRTRSRRNTLEILDQSKIEALDRLRESRKLLDRALTQIRLTQEEALGILGIEAEITSKETRKPRRDTGEH